MITPLAKLIDWYALQVIATLWLAAAGKWSGGESKLAEAVEFANGPDFLPVESEPAELKFQSKVHFQFQSPRPCPFAENNIVHGRLYRCGNDWQKFPVIVLLHGGSDILNHHVRFPWMVPGIRRAGFNAATLVAPYHFQRRVRRIEKWNHLLLAEAFAQAVAEIRTLTGWLFEQGCPSVALHGISLGAWFAGLAATRDTRLNAIVLAVPGVRTNYSVARGERILLTRVRKAFEAQKAAREALDKTPINLALGKPVIPRENILLLEGRCDLLVEPELTEELWQKWERPEIWRLPHGHVSWMLTPGINRRVLQWLTPRLSKPVFKAEEVAV